MATGAAQISLQEAIMSKSKIITKGTNKQNAWAEDIRSRIVDAAQSLIAKAPSDKARQALVIAVDEWIADQDRKADGWPEYWICRDPEGADANAIIVTWDMMREIGSIAKKHF
jgi:hypothetical protein